MNLSVLLFLLVSPIVAHSEDLTREPAAVPKLDRAYVSDRPGVTDNPHSMEAGAFRVESNLFGVTQSHAGPLTTTNRVFGNLSLIAAVSNSTELQFSADSIVSRRISDSGTSILNSAAGDATFKIKHNIYGNDGGELAVAVLPHVTFLGPLDGGRVDGGLSLAMSYLPTVAWAITFMPQYNLVHDSAAASVRQLAAGLLIAREISARWWGLVQYSAKSTEHAAGTNNVGFGAAYTVNSHMQVDTVVDFQVKSDSPDSNFSCGFTYRF